MSKTSSTGSLSVADIIRGGASMPDAAAAPDFAAPQAVVGGNTTYNDSLGGAVFQGGDTLSGGWTITYDAQGNVVDASGTFLVDVPSTFLPGVSTVETFTINGAYLDTLAAAPNDYQLTFTADNSSDVLYVDYLGETPNQLYAPTPGTSSEYTAFGHDGAAGVVLTDDGNVTCFVAGTAIATPSGEVAVESLAGGDLVCLAGGGTAAVRWVGRQTVATRFTDPLRTHPVLVRAGALAAGVPHRDLLVSPCHGLLVDGILAEAGALVNGTTILRAPQVPELVEYCHIELPEHALVLANGAAAESFVDNIDRMAFANYAEHAALLRNAGPVTEMALPRARSARQVPALVRARLAGAEIVLAA